MNETHVEDRVQELAYRLWQEAGSPDGRSDEFWRQAQQQLSGEPDIANGGEHEAKKPEGSPK